MILCCHAEERSRSVSPWDSASTRDSSLRQRVRAACRFATQRVRSTLRVDAQAASVSSKLQNDRRAFLSVEFSKIY
ncbi:hypothetical protein, partial [Brunnivagina elsteri]|uniref:hypothetical protein n=1 Tax=Brunnivagina elsteri TaxID=1247191 RepID=UPI001B800C35